jgi:hypothetical protein
MCCEETGKPQVPGPKEFGSWVLSSRPSATADASRLYIYCYAASSTWPRTVTCRSVEYVRRGRVGFEASVLAACRGLGWLAHAASGVGTTTFLSACASLDSASLRLEGSVLYQETTKAT